MPEIAIDVQVWCAGCGAGLCNETEVKTLGTRTNEPHFHVQPCSVCLETARDEGDDTGYTRGLEDGRNDV